jgi:hypothetical protein
MLRNAHGDGAGVNQGIYFDGSQVVTPWVRETDACVNQAHADRVAQRPPLIERENNETLP